MDIIISAEEELVQKAQQKATAEHTTLDELIRTWLEQYVARSSLAHQYESLMSRLTHIRTDRHFSREELNERS
jgi:hypothetical protein